MENQDDVKPYPPKHMDLQEYLNCDNDDTIVQELITVKPELVEENTEFTNTVVIVKGEPIGGGAAVKSETESKSVLKGCELIEWSIKSQDIDIKSDEADIQERCGEATDHLNDQWLSGTRQKSYSTAQLPQKSAKGKTVVKRTIGSFCCDHCDYQSSRNSNLKRHLLLHKNPEELIGSVVIIVSTRHYTKVL